MYVTYFLLINIKNNGEKLIKNINKNFFSKIGFNYLLLAIFAIIMQFIAGIILVFIPGASENSNIVMIITAICNYILPIPIFLYLMNNLEKKRIRKHSLSIFNFIVAIAIAITLMWIGNIFGLAITGLIGGVVQNEIANPVAEAIYNLDIWVNLLIMVIIAPIFEELFFRKLLIDRTIKYGGLVSVLLSAFMFALFHGNLNQFFYAFLIGGFFAFIYIKTGNILYSIALHMIVNFSGAILSVFIGNIMINIANGVHISTLDTLFIVIYSLVYFTLIAVGIIFLIKDRKKLKFKKSEKTLENPVKTIVLNIGMVCFIGFNMIQIILSIIR